MKKWICFLKDVNSQAGDCHIGREHASNSYIARTGVGNTSKKCQKNILNLVYVVRQATSHYTTKIEIQ